MLRDPKQSLFVAVALLAMTCVAACGSSADGASQSTASKSVERPFLPINEKGKIPSWGTEAPEGEREAASKVLEENLHARANHDWARQCATLTKRVKREFAERAAYYELGKSCPKALEFEAKGASKAVLGYKMSGPIDELRVSGHNAYVIFEGKDGKRYAMPMRNEANGWRVADIVETELSKPSSKQ